MNGKDLKQWVQPHASLTLDDIDDLKKCVAGTLIQQFKNSIMLWDTAAYTIARKVGPNQGRGDLTTLCKSLIDKTLKQGPVLPDDKIAKFQDPKKRSKFGKTLNDELQKFAVRAKKAAEAVATESLMEIDGFGTYMDFTMLHEVSWHPNYYSHV